VVFEPPLALQPSTEVQSKQAQQELSSIPKVEDQQPQTQATQQHSQLSAKVQRYHIPILKKQTEEE